MVKFVGMKKDEAFKLAAEKGFVLKMTEDYDDEVEAGVIIEQSVSEGENLRPIKEGDSTKSKPWN